MPFNNRRITESPGIDMYHDKGIDMDKPSLSRSNSTSHLEQYQPEERTQSVGRNADANRAANTINHPTPAPDGVNTASVTIALKEKPLKQEAESKTGLQSNAGVKPTVEIKTLILSSTDPTLSPRALSPTSFGTHGSMLMAPNTNPLFVMAPPRPSSQSPLGMTAATQTTTTRLSSASADQKKPTNSPGEIARVLIKAETAVQGISYKKEMKPGVVDRFLRGKVEADGINLVETMLVPFIEKQFGTSEYGNLFREMDARFLKAQPQIDALKNRIKAEMQNPIEYSEAILQRDPRLGDILDPVIKPLIDYITSDDSIAGSNLPAPFLEMLKATDNEILKWQSLLTDEAEKSGNAVPSQADVDIARKNAMVALIGIRSMSVMLSKAHGSQSGGVFTMLENYLIKTINKKCAALIQNIMSCPNDVFEKRLVEKRGQQITRKSSMRMQIPDTKQEKLPLSPRQESSSVMSPPGSVRKESASDSQLDKIAEHNQMLVSLFARKYKLTEIDRDFSLIFNKAMSPYIDEGHVNLSERAVKKECLKLLGRHMETLQRAGLTIPKGLHDLFKKLSGYAFAELEEAPQSPREMKSPRGLLPKKS